MTAQARRYTPDPAAARAARRVGLNPQLALIREGGFAKVREEARCRMCLRPRTIRKLTRHHVVPRRWFKDRPLLAALVHADANIVPLCQPCHAAVEHQRDRGDHARTELRRLLGAAEVTFALHVAGRAWLDDRYPDSRDWLEPDHAAARVQAHRRASESRAPSAPSRSLIRQWEAAS